MSMPPCLCPCPCIAALASTLVASLVCLKALPRLDNSEAAAAAGTALYAAVACKCVAFLWCVLPGRTSAYPAFGMHSYARPTPKRIVMPMV